MKILSSRQIKELDQFTIANEPVSSLDLMERASIAFTEKFCEKYPITKPVQVLCGQGNNGGDGLAIARLLHLSGYQVEVFIIKYSSGQSADCAKNEQLVKKYIQPVEIYESDDLPFKQYAVIIDAILGVGLNKPADGLIADIIEDINAFGCEVVAVDIATGLFADSPTPEHTAIKVTRTFSFHFPKLAFMLPENMAYVGEWEILNIGLSLAGIAAFHTDTYFTLADRAAALLKVRTKFAHKGSFGHALLVAGSKGKMGAGILSAKACMRTGCGLLSIHLPKQSADLLQISLPEAMLSFDKNEEYLTEVFLEAGKYSSVGIGPGIGKAPETVKMLEKILTEFRQPMVIDADALNIISENRGLITLIPPNSILTPHPKEFERLIGISANNFDRLQKLKQFAKEHHLIVVLKGAHTAIATPEGILYFNSTGNPGMAKGGSGDALTGILTALLAQNYPPPEAARLGVFLHGLAADIAVKEISEESLITSDLIDHLGKAFLQLHQIKHS